MFRWYVINTYSGHENKVKANLEHRVETMSARRRVRQVVVPTEEVAELKDGKREMVSKRTMPGYVLVNMEMTDDAWSLVKNTPGVTGFVGSRNKPIPLSQPEVDRLLHRETAERPRAHAQFEVGESVKVISGPMSDFSGEIAEINEDAAAPQGPGLDLRPRDAGRGRLRPGEEDLVLGTLSVLAQLSDPHVGVGPWRPRLGERARGRGRAGRAAEARPARGDRHRRPGHRPERRRLRAGPRAARAACRPCS